MECAFHTWDNARLVERGDKGKLESASIDEKGSEIRPVYKWGKM